MLKKEEFKKLASKYNAHLYTGLYGYVMRYCHRQLENFRRERNGKRREDTAENSTKEDV